MRTLIDRRRRPRVRRLVAGLVLLLVAAFVLAACGGSDDSGDAGMWDQVEAADGRAMLDSSADFEVPASPGEMGVMPPQPIGSPTGRHVVRSAEVVIDALDPQAALDEVIDIARRADGYAATLDVSTSPDGTVSAWVTLRVPADRLDAVVADIEAVGVTVPRSRVDEYDVTMEMVDVEARLDNLESFEQELLALLTEVREGDGGAEELLLVFERIREVRAEIDQLTARRVALRDQVDMATVNVGIQQRRTAADVSWSPADTVRDAFAALAQGLTRVADGVIWLVVTILPVAVVVAAPFVVLFVIWRRRAARRRTADRIGSPPTGSDVGRGEE